MNKLFSVFIDKKEISFGIPDSDGEKEEIFKLRYRVYLDRKYIKESDNGLDFDNYDNMNTVYLMAIFEDRIIGTLRLIREEFLPTEKDCFQFIEPNIISKIPRSNRAEIGRLVVERSKDDYFIPRHIIMIGLLYCSVLYAKQNGISGGYSFIKNSLKIKLDKLKFPFHEIKEFSLIYKEGYLANYFKNTDDKVWPIYYTTNEVFYYLASFFNNKLLFKKVDSGFKLRNAFLYGIFIKYAL